MIGPLKHGRKHLMALRAAKRIRALQFLQVAQSAAVCGMEYMVVCVSHTVMVAPYSPFRAAAQMRYAACLG